MIAREDLTQKEHMLKNRLYNRDGSSKPMSLSHVTRDHLQKAEVSREAAQMSRQMKAGDREKPSVGGNFRSDPAHPQKVL